LPDSITPERWQKVKDLLHSCLDLPAAERSRFLEEACNGDTAIRGEVESLLASYEEAGDFLQQPPLGGDSPGFGDRLGVYQIVQKIGEGGMGVVYQAVRNDDQFHKLVAIKVVKRGMDTEYVLERFHNERQILAHFDHPHIAKLLDGGVTPDGLPYVVMEFIAGRPIDEYSDAERLSVNARLELFLKVCSAVNYAHQNLVVHRDLKPRNVLVTENGDPKLLDFGIAKMLGDERDFTLPGIRMMTPDYASPEQVRGQPINTSSDVYSLGVLLYELLSGHRPYQIKGRSPEEAAQTVWETDPARPSTAIRREEEGTIPGKNERGILTAEMVSDARDARPERLQRQLEGDLDNIVLMAMRKEPQLRYASVEQFAADIRRHQEGQPVMARKATVGYRMQKFVSRHTAGVTAAVVVFLTLLGGIVVSTWQANIARQQRERAERRFNDVRKLANSILFELHDAIIPLPGSTKARELLLRRAQEYLDSLAQEAKEDAPLQRERALAYQRIGDVMGSTWQANFGKGGQALENQRKALAIFQGLVAADPANVELQRDLGTTYRRVCSLQLTSGKFQDAFDACTQDLKLREAIAKARPDNRTFRYELGFSYQSMAGPLLSMGQFKRSEEYRGKSLAIYTELHKADPSNRYYHFELAVAHLRMANLQEQLKEYPAALENARKAVSLYEELSALEPDDVRWKLNTTFALQRVGSVLISLNDLPGALEVFQKSLPLRQRLSALDPNDARTKMNLCHSHESIGWVLIRLGRVREADEHFRKQLDLAQQLVSTDPVRIEYQRALAGAYENQGSVFEHKRNCREARASYEKALRVFDALQARKALSAEYSQMPAKLQKAIAACKV
jgi:non-specific serine/threonine protein kinase/serine/threonine-protein kinase